MRYPKPSGWMSVGGSGSTRETTPTDVLGPVGICNEGIRLPKAVGGIAEMIRLGLKDEEDVDIC